MQDYVVSERKEAHEHCMPQILKPRGMENVSKLTREGKLMFNLMFKSLTTDRIARLSNSLPSPRLTNLLFALEIQASTTSTQFLRYNGSL